MLPKSLSFHPWKSLLATTLLTLLTAAPLLTQAQTVFFNDTFGNGSTLNGTSTPGGTAAASSTSYDVASTKADNTAPAIGAGKLHLTLNGGTTAGYTELQAIFASTPVHLVNVGDSINLTIAFTNGANTLLAGGNGSVICVGLYNSGGALPVAGSLNNSGLGNLNTFTNGFCQNWQGYVAQVSSNTLTSKIYTRAWQKNTNNANQDLLYSGAGTGLYNTPGGTQIGGSFVAGPTLVNGAKYIMSFTILLSAPGTVSLTNNLFDASGNLLSMMGGTSGAANTYTNLANLYDGLSIGIANKGTSLNPQMDISQITISTNYYFSPTITGLANETVVAGTSPTLSPVITGNPAPTYQWYVSTDSGATSNAISGATGATLTLSNVQYSQNNNQYTLVAANTLGASSATMTLSVIVTPSITGLNNQAAQVGSTVTINPTVGGVPAPTFQWQTNGVNLADGPDANGSTIAGSTTSTLSVTDAQAGDTATYSLIASNSAGIVTNSMTLTVAVGNLLPQITGPTNITVIPGNNGTFSASAIGVPVPTYQWLDQTQTPISGETSGTLTLNNVQFSHNGFSYYFVASNAAGSVTNHATLTVIVAPAITTQPTNLVVTNVQPASFTVVASGVPAPSYQWFFNGNPISLAANSSANSATLSFAHAAPANTGTYSVQVSNAAGTTNSASVTLTVNSTMSIALLSPANAATGVCYDTPLYLTFNQPPILRTAGQIRIFNVNNPATPVDTIDLTQCVTNFPGLAANVQAYSIGGQVLTNFPVVINGNTAAIYPHHGLLTSNQTYYVTVDAGTFADSTGAYFTGIGATNAWKFTTKKAGPVNPTNLVVTADGSGDFLTVQGAIDSVPANNTTPTIINVRNGTYFELINVNAKNNLDFRGQSRNGVFIGYPNNNNVFAGAPQRASFILNGNDCSFETMTLTNMTPAGGSQAEAVDVEGTRAIFDNIELDSFQDTFLVHSAGKLVYFQDCLIQGQTDFNWGYGSVYYTNCELRCVLSGGHVTQPRSPATTNGFGFINCRITKGYTGTAAFDLGRTISTPTSPSEVLYANCLMDSVITGYSSDAGPNMSDYSCSNLTATTLLTSLAFSTHLTASDPHVIAIQTPFGWLGWQPMLVPNIVNAPSSQSAGGGQSVSFSAGATGVPNPNYQWLFNGSPISGATSATYNLAAAQATNAGNYSLVVNNGSGSVTSLVATLTYVLPVANPATYTRYAGYPLGISIINLTTNVSNVSPNDVISLVGTGVSTNGVMLGNSSGFLLYQNPNNVNDQFTYTLTDGFLGTNSGLVSIVISTNSVFGSTGPAIQAANGVTSITYAGIPGYSYSVSRTTNLLSGWTTIWTTNMPVGGTFQFIDSNPTQPAAYYLLLWNWY